MLQRLLMVLVLCTAMSTPLFAQPSKAPTTSPPEAKELRVKELTALLNGTQNERTQGRRYLMGAWDAASSAATFLSQSKNPLLFCAGFDAIAKLSEQNVWDAAQATYQAGIQFVQEAQVEEPLDTQPIGHIMWLGVMRLAVCVSTQGAKNTTTTYLPKPEPHSNSPVLTGYTTP